MRTNIKKSEITQKLRTDETAAGEKAAESRLSEAEFHKGLILEEQRQIFEDKSARAKGGTCRRCHPRIEQTNSFSSDGDPQCKSSK